MAVAAVLCLAESQDRWILQPVPPANDKQALQNKQTNHIKFQQAMVKCPSILFFSKSKDPAGCITADPGNVQKIYI